jgi:hypothetical protein
MPRSVKSVRGELCARRRALLNTASTRSRRWLTPSFSRGNLTILDGRALESASCACHDIGTALEALSQETL